MTKELKKQLKKEQARVKRLEETIESGGGRAGGSARDRSGSALSLTSLEGGGAATSHGTAAGSAGPSPGQPTYAELEEENNALLARIGAIQQEAWAHEEAMRSHQQTLRIMQDELDSKNRSLQAHIARAAGVDADVGASGSQQDGGGSGGRSWRNPFGGGGGGSGKDSDGSVVNSKLQGMYEAALIENENLGNEVERLRARLVSLETLVATDTGA